MNITKWSDPQIVLRQAIRFGYPPQDIFLSTRKAHKYMIRRPDGKPIHFGRFGMEDYTLHRDPNRRRRFQQRNHKWAHAPRYTPRHLSYYLLW